MTATSRTWGSPLPAAPCPSDAPGTSPALDPEADPSICEQNGQAVATTSAPVCAASAIRASAMRVPRVSSNHACAPPAPQHIARSLLRGISTSSTPGRAATSSRGGE